MSRKNNLVWVDLEMTGLEPEKDVILEIASIITDGQLNVIDKGPNLVIHHENGSLDHMEDWVKQVHTESGLLNEVYKSNISEKEAEEQTLEFIKKYCDHDTALLAGNSVWQDRNFLKKYMPSIVDYCYYRLLDITAIKEVVAHWYPQNPLSKFEKKDEHRALSDVKESLEELRHFRKYFFVK